MRLWVAFLAFVLIASCGEGNLDFPGAGDDESGLSGTETPATETPGTETPTPEGTPSATPTPLPSGTPNDFPGFQCVEEPLGECSLFAPCCEGSTCVPSGLLPPGTVPADVPSVCLPMAPPA